MNKSFDKKASSRQLSSISYFVCTVAILWSCILSTTVSGGRTDVRDPDQLLQRVFQSFQAVLNFFGEDNSSVNVDGLFGIRMGQGCVNQTIEDCAKHGYHCPQELVRQLKDMNARIEEIASHAMPYVLEQDEDYFNRFRLTLDAPYILQYQPQMIGETGPALKVDVPYDETLGDQCLSSLMGTYENTPRCTITKQCWDMMTQKQTNGYTLTHQLLYFIVLDKADCESEVQQWLKGRSLREHETEQCVQILAEARSEVRRGRVSLFHQDLFLEQGALCGVLGFQDFMTPEWVNMVISWQNGMGCFTVPATLRKLEERVLMKEDEERKLISQLKKEAYEIDHFQPTRRKLLREHVMKGDCLAHKTGLGFGILAAYIRHFVNILYGGDRVQN